MKYLKTNKLMVLVPTAAVINIIILAIESLMIKSPNFYISVLVSIINSILCYGIVSIIAMNGDGEKKTKKISLLLVLKMIMISACTVICCYFFQNAFLNVVYCFSGYVPKKYMELVSNIIYVSNDYTMIEQIIIIISFGMIIPIYEELFFRFLLVKRFQGVSCILRFIVANMCFLLLHESIDLIIFILPMSIVCVMCVEVTGRIIYPIIIHCVVNIVGILELPLGEIIFSPRYPIKYAETKVAFSNGVFCGLIVVFLLCLIYSMLKGIRRNEDRIQLFKGSILDNLCYILVCFMYIILVLVI